MHSIIELLFYLKGKKDQSKYIQMGFEILGNKLLKINIY